MPTRPVVLLLTLLALALPSAVYAAQSPPQPWTVRGVAVDTQGKPLRGTIVWMLPSVTDGVVQTTTDAQGRYITPRLIDMPYEAYAWQRVPYQGQLFCLRLAAETPQQYAPFSPRSGVIRNFRLRLTGTMPDQNREHAYFGAELRLMNGGWEGTSPLTRDAQIEVTLTPDGPLIDGSAGHTILRKVNFEDGFLYDLPVGRYTASAVELHADGSRTRLVMNAAGSFQSTLQFKATDGTCGGYGGSNGVERAFLDLARPQP